MARARTREGRHSSEISNIILAEWYRVMPLTGSITEDDIQKMDMSALTAAFNAIIEGDRVCKAVLDGDGENSPLIFVVPRPPRTTRAELDRYVERNGDFQMGMGAAILFGCGR